MLDITKMKYKGESLKDFPSMAAGEIVHGAVSYRDRDTYIIDHITGSHIEVVPGQLETYTGEKDSKKNEIYTGDKLSITSFDPSEDNLPDVMIGEVFFDKAHGCFKVRFPTCDDMLCEVILRQEYGDVIEILN